MPNTALLETYPVKNKRAFWAIVHITDRVIKYRRITI